MYVNLKEDAIIQHYCGVCSNPIDCGSSCGQGQCAKAQLPLAVFIRVPLTMQLKELFEGKITVQLKESVENGDKPNSIKIGFIVGKCS